MKLVKAVYNSLDDLKRLTNDGIEYWMARDLQKPLGYSTWREFEAVIKKAQMACDSSGSDSNNHFVEKYKMASIGSGAKRKKRDYFVSRYGAYLIAMNGNPKLQQIAMAQNYFAVQTRRQEIADIHREIEKRIELRERVKSANKHLGDAAKDSGVQDYARFHAAGYRGLYDLRLKEIKERKNIDPKDELLDRAGRAELAANEFRITQTEQALKRNEIEGDIPARKTHEKVGKEVRNTIAKLGGTMPEDLPAEPSIKKLMAGSQKKTKLLKKREEQDENGKS
jgi:DNA-damage-inducible protein D